MRNKHLERRDYLCERDTLVTFPFLERLHIIDEDNEIFVCAFVVDFELRGSVAGHGDVGLRGSWVDRIVLWKLVDE